MNSKCPVYLLIIAVFHVHVLQCFIVVLHLLIAIAISCCFIPYMKPIVDHLVVVDLLSYLVRLNPLAVGGVFRLRGSLSSQDKIEKAYSICFCGVTGVLIAILTCMDTRLNSNPQPNLTTKCRQVQLNTIP